MKRKRQVKMIRMVPFDQAFRDFDNEFWRRLGVVARLDAAWELVVFAHGLKGRQKRVQKSVVTVRRLIPGEGRGKW